MARPFLKMSLTKYILDLQQFGQRLPDVLTKIVKKNEKKIVGLVRTRLYRYGVDGDGNEIVPTYSRSTIETKREKGQIASHVTLRDTGLFYSSLFLELEGYNLLLNSSDEKATALLDKYGEAIFFFTKQEKDFIINEIIDPELDAYIDNLGAGTGSAGSLTDIDIYG
jgi:hypothetical protein